MGDRTDPATGLTVSCEQELPARWPSETSEGDLGVAISDLWYDERCAWHIDFDEGAHIAWPWTVVLEWTQEYGNPHGADWVTYTWQFYGDTVERALTEAVGWLTQLEPWRRCGDCGGEGNEHQTACVACGGSGFANPPESVTDAEATQVHESGEQQGG